MVKIALNNLTSKIIGYLPEEVHSHLDKTLSYKMKNARYIPAVKNRKWDGVIHLYKQNQGQSFYSGLLSLVTEVLEENKIPYQKVDERVRPIQNLPHLVFSPPTGFEERDYQKFTIDRSLKMSRGILKIATGGGKTLIAAQIIAEIKTSPFMFYVLTEDLLRQAHEVLSSTLNEPIGIIGGGEFNIRNINVCTIQTAVRAIHAGEKIKISDYQFDEDDIWDKDDWLEPEKKEQLRKFIFGLKGVYNDETHHVASRTCREVMSASPNALWRFGGSATPYREDGAEIIIQAMFGKKIVDVSASYLIKKGYLVKPYIIFDPINDDCNLHSYPSVYKECVSENDTFNTRVANISKYLISKGLSVLILVQQYNQGNYIKKLLPTDIEFLTGKMSRNSRKKSLQDIKEGKTKCIIGTTLFDEGVDCPCLDVVLMAGGGASSTRVYQRIGRTLRTKGTKDKALVIYFEHDAKHLEKHAKKARRIMKEEPEFEIIKSSGGDYVFEDINQIYGLENSNKDLFSTIKEMKTQ